MVFTDIVYNCNDLNRLVQVDQCDPAGVRLPIEDYAYDGEGNRLASHLSSLYSSNAHNQLLEDDRYTYAYDARGNRVSRTEKATGAVETYGYDSQNRLVRYASDTTDVTYAYDAIERRIAKTVDGVTTAFILDQMGRPNTLEPSNIVLEFMGEGLSARWLYSASVDEPLGIEQYAGPVVGGSGTSYSLYSDREGSISHVIADATGDVAAEYAYDAFGTRIDVSGVFDQPYGYRGRELDTKTGLYHLRWRAYDPAAGQFLQMDPIGFGSGQENLYAYVANNPFMAGDPMGLSAYLDYRAGIDARKQALGSATRSISSGVFGLLGETLEAMAGDWRNFDGTKQSVSSIGPATGGGGRHGNKCTNERGQHLYAIYSRQTGMTAKVGVAGNQRLTAGGTQSRRALEQIATFANPEQYNHVVLLETPGGIMARAQMLILENFMVAFLGSIGAPVDGNFHDRPSEDSPLPC